MRWPFRRDASHRPDAPGSASPSPDREWESLEPLRPTAPRIELTAPTPQFVTGLDSRRLPELALAPLEHQVSKTAPIGIVRGLVTSARTSSGERAVHDEPLRFARPPEPGAGEASIELPHTSEASELPPIPAYRHLEAVQETPGPEAAPAAAPVPTGQVQRAPLDSSAEETPKPLGLPPRAASPEEPSAEESSPPASLQVSSAEQRERPVGLGPRLGRSPAGGQGTARRRVQRAPAIPKQPEILDTKVPSTVAPAPIANDPPVYAPPDHEGAPLGLVRRVRPVASAQAEPPDRPRLWPAGAYADAAPTLGTRPAPSTRVQRAPEQVPSEVRAMVERATGAQLGSVLVHRDAHSESTAAEISARAYTTDGEIHLPALHGSLGEGSTRSLLAHELVHVAQQRDLGSSLPSEDSPAGRLLEAQATAMEHGFSPATIGPPSRSSPSRATGPRGVMRAPETASSLPLSAARPLLRVQRAPEEPSVVPAPEPEPPAPPAPPPSAPLVAAPAGGPPASAAAEGPPAGTPAAVGGPAELDELARKLYERLRRQLTADLIVKREQAGILADLH
jgi:hypothetical protein